MQHLDTPGDAAVPRRARFARWGRLGLATAIVGASSAVLVVTLLDAPVAEAAPLCATPPTTGSTTVSGVVNTYYPALTSITAGVANTTITVGSARGAATPLAAGDLALVIQMQGAAIDADNNSSYGDGTNGGGRGHLNNAAFVAGTYEYATVTGVSGSTVSLAGAGANGGLLNTYTNVAATGTQGQQRFQLVRVPQYATATLGAATAAAWDGTSGGLFAIDASVTLTLGGGTIDVNGLGFRGGLQRRRSGASGLNDTDYRTPTSSASNGQKGEGIAGTPRWTTGDPDTVGDGYPNGDFSRGAPGNAGGGGTDGNPGSNDENTGGGGGGNGGQGGRGGNSWNSNEQFGGIGGATVPGTASRVFLGGGGGAGSDNNAVGSSAGGAGGGAVLIRAGALSGTGSISANGLIGSVSGQDGGGGGGAGGSVVVLTSATGAASGLSGLTVTANGGGGGNTTYGSTNPDRHGPGGGGGGGRIITSSGVATASATGGVNGIHTPTNDVYGAQSGNAGGTSSSAVIGDAPGTSTGSQCIDVAVTKSVNPTPVVPGNTVTYTVTATNNGPYPVTGTAPVGVADALPAGLSAATWTCSASAGSSCASVSGSGDLATTANLARGGSATYTITATLSPSFTGTLSNTAGVTAPAGVVDFAPANNTATAAAAATPRADLSITKTDGSTTATPGTNVTYTVVASNAGPSRATNAIVTDALPAGATSGTWTCTAGACGVSSGSMPMNTTVTLDPSQTATWSVSVAVASTATGTLTNIASITAPAGTTDPNAANNSATDADTLTPRADLSIAKTDGVSTRNAGEANPYTITVTNAGPSTVSGATVADAFPAAYTGASWTCAATAGSSCPASGSGNINASVTLAPAGTATFTVNGTVAPTATGTLSNTATVTLPGGVTDPTPANNTATDTTTITRSADLSITKTDGAAAEIPGTSVTYTIVASNAGPSTATAAPVADTLPPSLINAAWTCSATAGSSCGAANGTGSINTTVTLSPAGSATFTLTATVAPGATGDLVNTATIAAPGGTTDPNLTNNSATDTDTLTPQADLAITKTDGAASAIPGTGVTYTIVASNAGPSTASGATVSDTLPAALTSVSWTCVAAGGATCPAGGSGDITAGVTLPPGGTATLTVTGTIDPAATGSLSNTATVSPPGGVSDPTPADNSATDVTTLTPTGDLSITKTDGTASAVPGTGITYTVNASNAGPSVMTDVAVTDAIPAAITNVTWTCAGALGGTCSAAGSGDIADTVTLPVGASVTYTVTGTISSTATGSLVNTATVAAGPGSVDPDGSNNSATDTDALVPTADVSITKSDGAASAVPGETITYTIVASNAGPSAAPGTVVSDVFPADLNGVSWTCAAAGGATCPVASGTDDIGATVDLPVAGSVTYTATGTVSAGATGSLANTATASVGTGVTDPDPSNNAATDSDALTPQGDLVITKTDGAATAVPGQPITYTIVATNAGPSTVTGATVTDTLPSALLGATWTCSASAGSSCPAGGSGDLDETLTLSSGGSATFTVTATVAASATGTLANTAAITAPGGVTDPTPANNSATDTDTLTPAADLSVTKTDGVVTEIPGSAVVYTVVVANAGPSDVAGATVTDVLPAAIVGGNWACSATPGSACPASGTGDIDESVSLLAGGSATFTITGTIDPAATGNLVNTATVVAPAGVTDPEPANDTATDTDALTPAADLSITKTDGLAAVIPGQAVTYTIVVTNAGPSTATGATVSDTFPAALTGVTWTCSGAGGGSCADAGGAGSLATDVTLPPGATATFTVDATVAPSASGTVLNTATVAVPAGVTDPDPADNSATDTDTVTATADLSITKTDGVASAVPGEPITYTIVAANAGPSAVTGATVTDALPGELISATWTCVGSGGAVCPASGSGSLAESVDLPAGASAAFTVSATVDPAASGTLVNTATVAVPAGVIDPDGSNDAATDVDTLTPIADLSVTKTDGATSATPGGSTTYAIVVSNAGPSAITAAPVTDALPAGATGGSWTCAPIANCAAPAGVLPLASSVTLAPLDTVTYTVSVDIDPAATGTLVNAVQVAVPTGVTDPDPANNAATDSDTLTPTADLSVTKTDGLTTVVNGEVVTYTVVVTNPGPSAVAGATVSDAIPAQLGGVSWTCAATGGSTCTATGSGDIADTVTIAAGASLTYTVQGTVTAAATGTITNTATVALPGGIDDPTPANNGATDTTDVAPEADLSVTKTDGVAAAVPGGTTTYTIVVANAGPADVAGATVSDPLPSGAAAMAWTCTATGGASCDAGSGTGAISETVDLPVGGELTYTVDVDIATSAAGSLVNVATVSAPGAVTDPDPANDVATDVDALTPQADVSVTKTDGATDAVPGGTTTYTIVVANAGPSDAPATQVADAEPAGATFTSWSCAPDPGAACAAATGSGPIATTVDLPAGASATFTVTTAIDPSATGTLDNTATGAVAAGITDTDPVNDTATDVDTLTPEADLSVTKTNGAAYVVPGTTVEYTIVVANAGPSDASGATVADVLPAQLAGATWTCTGSGGATCAASGAGDVNEPVDLPAGGSVTFTVTGSVPASASGTLDNTATVAAPAGVIDPEPANDEATDTDPLVNEADLSITKTDGVASAVPGEALTYTIVATNAGPSVAPGSLIEDTFPTELSGVSWTCVAAGGAVCPSPSGTADLAETVDLPVGGSVTYTVSGTVAAGATGALSNTATVSVGPGVGDPAPGNNVATDLDTLTPTADLSITKTDGAVTAIPGTPITYTVVATNAGPSAVAGATVSDAMPAALTGVSWTCTAPAGSVCPAAGIGDINALVSLQPGAAATFEVDAVVVADAHLHVMGTLDNTATVTLPGGVSDPTPANNSATDSDTLTPQVDLSVTKTDGTGTATPGATTIYTIVVANAGPSDVSGVTVDDALPTGVTAMSWTCVASIGSSCSGSGSGSIAELVDLAAGGDVTFTVTVDIAADATGTLANEVSVDAPSGVTELTPADNTATDTDTLEPAADLSVTKTDGAASAVPGTSVTYTITVANAGPSDVVGADVADTLPAELTGATWTCTATGGGTCTAAGSGDIADVVDLPAGASATYVLTAAVDAGATGTLANTATVAAPAGVTDPDPANDASTDTDTLTPVADLSVTKTDGAASAVPGTPVPYTIVATNAGPSDVVGATVGDVIPASLLDAEWTCSASAGSSCPIGGTGAISAPVDLVVGGTATFTLTADIDQAATISLANTATITPPADVTDPNPGDNSATDTDTLTPVADLSITKSDGLVAAQPGDPVTYTIDVANAGPSAVADATITDTIPAALGAASWTCTAGPGGACDEAGGAGDVDTTVDLAAGGSVTITVAATVVATSGVVTNVAEVEVPAGVTDPEPSDNVATDVTSITPTADLSITKTDGLASVSAGETVTYTITVVNAGPSPISGATVTDDVPDELTALTWTCTATAGSSCESASGSGDLDETVTLAAGGSIVYTLTGTVPATQAAGTLTNQATVAMPGGSIDPTPSDNTDTDTTAIERSADLSITKTDGSATAVPGAPITYTIEVANAGPAAVAGAQVTDAMPAELTAVTWSCTATLGGSCTTPGSGDIADSIDLPPGGTATYVVEATVAPGATGTLANTATVNPPADVTDPNPGDNTATDTDALTPQADLWITKDDGSPTAVPGATVTYTITVGNAGPSATTEATVADVTPADLTAVSWTCVGAGGGACAGSGTGDITEPVDLPAGGSVTFSLTGSLAADATADLVNTATVAAPAGVTDPEPTNDVATDIDTLTPQADLSITKTDGSPTAVPGTAVTYTIVATNAGPSDAPGSSVADTLPPELSNAAWTCVAAGGSSCTGSGAGGLAEIVDLPAGGSVTYTVTADLAPDATGTLANTAAVAPPAGVTEMAPGDNSATDTDTLTPQADLSITKTDGLTNARPGDPVTYTIEVGNAGPSAVAGAIVDDPIPAQIDSPSWTCAATAGSSCPAAGSGDLAALVDLGVGGSVTFTVTGTVAGTAEGIVTNAATVTAPAGVIDPAPADNTASDATTIDPLADLSITKTDGNTTAVAGEPIAYTIVVTNAGPSAIADAPVTDVAPAALLGATWTCTATSGSSCDDTSGAGSIATTVDLAASGSATFNVSATIDPAFTGLLTNTAMVAMPAPGLDPTPANNSATDDTTVAAEADLVVTKTDGVATAVPGEPITYTVTVANLGPSSITGAVVGDSLSATLLGPTWTCTAGGGGTCGASGSGSLLDPVDLPVGASLTYVIEATIDPAATGTLTNTATITAPPGITVRNPGDDTATDTTDLVPEADLAITKTDGATSAVPGEPIAYTITVTNAGPSDVVGATVTDVVPAELVGAAWTCGPTGGASCAAAGFGDIADTVDLPAGSSVEYTLIATVAGDAIGSLVNTASVSAPAGVVDPQPANDSSTDTDVLVPTADLSVTKDDGLTDAVPGQAVTYTITVANTGPSDVVGADVHDAVPVTLTGVTWTCSGAAGGSCTATGADDVDDTVDLPAGATIVYTVTGSVDPTASGNLVNTVTVSAPAGIVDPDPANNAATDTDALTPTADLSVTKDDGLTNARPGDPVTYTITVANAGPSAAIGAQVDDAIPASLAGAAWTCAGAGGGVCSPSGSGDIAELVDLPPGASVTFTVDASVAIGSGTITNTVTVVAPAGTTDPDAANNAATDATTVDPIGDLSVTKTDGQASVTPGTPTSYTIAITNAGPSDALGVEVDDTLPGELVNATWTCSGSVPGASCGGSGTGDIDDLVDLPAGASVTYTVVADIAGSATGTLDNTVAITPPAGFTDTDASNDSATDTSDVAPVVDLSITKTDGTATATPGLPVTYSIVVTNAGPSDATGTRIEDPLPAALSGATWTCSAAPGSTCAASGAGSIDEVVTVGAGSSLTFTLTATVDAAASGTLTNTATVTPAPGTTDASPGDDTATDTDALVATADLSITKTDGIATATPGLPVTYSIVVTNAGPSAITGARVLDAVSAALTGATWTCGAGTGGGSCAVDTGSDDIDVALDLPVGATVTLELDATVAAWATGTLVNTASVVAPGGSNDPDPTNDTATDTDTLAPAVNLAVTKDDGVASAVPGTSSTYTIGVTNSGPSDVVGALVDDPVPAGAASVAWTCSGTSGGACAQPSGSGPVSVAVDVPVGGNVTITATVAIDPTATGVIANTVTVTPPSGTLELDPSDNAATDTDALTPQASLSITKSDGLTTALPGDTLTYTLVVTNSGPSAVADAPVGDAVPVELENAAWTCVASGGSCGAASGSGDIATAVTLVPGGTATFILTADVISSAVGAVVNTAIVDAPAGVTDLDPLDNVATDSTTVSPLGDVSITKTDGLTTVTAGTATTYVVSVANPGPSVLPGVRVQDPLPAALTSASWTCAASGGATCTPSGVGSIDDLVDLPPGGAVVYTLSATVAASATGTLSNTATATLPAGAVDPTPANNTATDTTTVVGETALSITKTDGVASATPGSPVTYTITATNAGPSDAAGARVTDVPPAALGAVTWSCTGTGGGACPASGTGAIDALVTLPVGGSVTFTLSGTIAGAATGTLTNVATIATPAGASDPDPSDNAATDTDTLVPEADIAVTKTDGATILIPGTSTTYTIVVSNLGGPSTISGVQIVDPLPAGAVGASWTCSAAPGSACGAASGSGPLATTATVAPGADVTYTVTMQTAVVGGTLTNVVTASVPPGAVERDPSNNTASDVNTLQLTGDLSVTKLASVTEVQPGNVFSYTVVVRNAGPNPLSGVAVNDPVPAGLQSMTWNCLASGSSSCAASSGTGAVATTVTLGVNETVTLVIVVRAAGNASGTIVNTATVAPPPGSVDPDTSDNAATATVTVTPIIPPPAIELTKTTSTATYDTVGDVLAYTLTAVNTGGVTLTGVEIRDAGAEIVNCNRDQPAVLAPGEQLVCDAVRVADQADLDRGSIANTATVVAIDPDGNTIGDLSDTIVVPANVTAALAIAKSTTSPGFRAVGDVVRYTIVVTNTGTVTIVGVTITDTVAVLLACPPRPLAPGESMTCTAERSVIQADLDAGRIDNIATAQGETASSGSVRTVSGTSNLVTVRRIVTLPSTGGDDGDGGLRLPGTGADAQTPLSAAAAVTAIGVVLMAIGRRRRSPS